MPSRLAPRALASGPRAGVPTTFRRRLGRWTEPQVLFPAFGVVALALVWGITLKLIQIEHANAVRTALASSRKLIETYEAQVFRAVREIDVTLKVAKYAYESNGGTVDLAELADRELLPPDLVFVVSIADLDGNIVASTRPLAATNVAERQFFQEQRLVDSLSVSRPRQDASGEWALQFARRLNDADGYFAGAAIVTVGAEFFVSGYEPAELGEQGVLALIGTDGVIRARRTGDAVAHGETVDYASAIPGVDQEDIQVALVDNPWDGVRRYTSARQLYNLPLTVVVGLAQAEQLANADRNARVYRWRATAVSVALVLLAAAVGRLSWQLAASRRRTIAIKVEYARQVENLAFHDGLTGLPNRILFSKLLQQSIQEARRLDRKMAVLFLDLDRFKEINDTLGHEAGDQLLQQVAGRLRECVRDSDPVSRLGGDEFVVLLPELTDPALAATVAQKIIAALAKPFQLLGQDFRVTCSVGIASYPRDGLDEQTLTKNADIAMYKAKEQGKNNYQFYSEQLITDSLERLTLESSLRQALERGEFELYYQAKRDLESGRVSGMEALLRWQHPDLGTVAPMRFIPLAEQTGLIVPIGKWVLRTACLQNVAWQAAGLPSLVMAVNLTARQFADPHLLLDLTAMLADTGMAAELLELEIAENILMRDVERSLRILTGLRSKGIRVAVDDFGAGYSTLTSLDRFPLDTVKIDRSFIREVTHVAEDQALAEAIIAMGKSLSLTVVAQGVETREQEDYLREHGCDQLQGFYYSLPLPAARVAEVLRGAAGAAAAAIEVLRG